MPEVKPRRKNAKYRNTKDALAQPITGGNGGSTLPADEFFEQASGHELLRLVSEIMAPPLRFGDFVEQMKYIELEAWEIHLTNRLEQLVDQTGQRILIHKPPQFGGSTIVSECLPAYLMGRDPMYTFREVTHNQEHSEEFSETVQAMLRSQEYEAIFPSTQIPKQTNLTEWSTKKRETQRQRSSQSSYRAIGIQGAMTGIGGRCFLVDDPYGNPKDAHSAAINADIRRWHNKLLIPRLTPESNLVVMYHRFQPDDYGGWLQSQPGWEVIRYSALADREDPPDPLGRELDEPLAPKRYPWEYLNNLREMDPDSFYSLYQGLPQNPEGDAVKRGWFPIQHDYDEDGIPAFNPKLMLGAYIYFDIGASSKGDETVGTLGCAMPDNSWTWLWQMTGHWNPAERDDKIIEFSQLIASHMRVMVFLEEGIGLGRESVGRIVMKIKSKGIPADTIRSVGSKWERANDRQDAFRSVAQAGRIRLYDGDYLENIGLKHGRAAWIEPYLREVTQLQIKNTDHGVKLVGKDNKWDSGTGLHNALLKLSTPVLTLGDRAALGRRFRM